MYARGHVGAALLWYGPLGAALARAYSPGLALSGAAVAVALSTLPDADEPLPIPHRGPTHTVWFVLAVAGLAAAVGWAIGSTVGLARPAAVTVGAAAALSVSSHVAADSVTPMGIRPLAPLSAWHHTFDLTDAADPRANARLLAAGATVAAGCLWAGIAL